LGQQRCDQAEQGLIKYMLDTNICIYLMNHQPEVVIARFKKCRKGEVVISAVTWAELTCGLDTHQAGSAFDSLLGTIAVAPFDIKAAAMFGKLSQQFPSRKSSFDRMIAAHALALKLKLVTNNVADFSAYGLDIENWATST
jgi:tRNA(fMet)-specific endonuclease VapC